MIRDKLTFSYTRRDIANADGLNGVRACVRAVMLLHAELYQDTVFGFIFLTFIFKKVILLTLAVVHVSSDPHDVHINFIQLY